MKQGSFSILGMFLIGTLFSGCALSMDAQDIVSGLNTLPLLMNKITGDTTMTVAYDPADATSKADAENIKK